MSLVMENEKWHFIGKIFCSVLILPKDSVLEQPDMITIYMCMPFETTKHFVLSYFEITV